MSSPFGKRCNEAVDAFIHHFGYIPGLPELVDFDEDAYAADLERSVADNFDYTIELYDTIPSLKHRDPNEVIID